MLHHPIFLKENPCCSWITRFPLVQATTVKKNKQTNMHHARGCCRAWCPGHNGSDPRGIFIYLYCTTVQPDDHLILECKILYTTGKDKRVQFNMADVKEGANLKSRDCLVPYEPPEWAKHLKTIPKYRVRVSTKHVIIIIVSTYLTI